MSEQTERPEGVDARAEEITDLLEIVEAISRMSGAHIKATVWKQYASVQHGNPWWLRQHTGRLLGAAVMVGHPVSSSSGEIVLEGMRLEFNTGDWILIEDRSWQAPVPF